MFNSAEGKWLPEFMCRKTRYLMSRLGVVVASMHESIEGQLQAGGRVDGSTPDLVERAQALGYAVFEADCSKAKSCSAVLRAIANAVYYPEYFGSNLDALLDCLTGTVLDQPRGALVILRGLNKDEPGIAPHVEGILETFADAVEYLRDNQRILVY